MEQGDRLLQHGEEDLVVGFLLRGTELPDVLGMGLAAEVQPSYLYLVGFQQPAPDQLGDGIGRSMGGVHQFIPGYGGLPFFAQEEVFVERLELLGRTDKHVEGNVECLFVAIGGGEAYEGLGLGTVSVLGLQPRRQRCLIDLADG